MSAKESKRLMMILAAAVSVSGLGAQAGAVQTFWSRGAGTDDLLTSLNWLGGSHPAQTAEAVIDDLHGGATYATPGIRYFGGTGGGQRFGQLTLDSPTLTNLYAYSTNITTINPVTLWATAGSNIVLSIGPNVGATAAQTITIADNVGVNGSLYLALNFTPVAANDPAIINVTNPDATLIIGSSIRNNTGGGTDGIEKTGSGTLVLNNPAANTFGGANQIVRVTGGILSYSADNNLGNSADKVVLNGGTLQFITTTATGTVTTTRAFSIAAPSQIDLNVNGSFLYQINGALSGSESLTKTGTTELAMNNAAGSYTGTLTVNQGSVRLLNPGSVAGATIALNATNSTLDLRNDSGGNYNVNVDASTKNAQIYVDHQTASGTGGLFQLGNVKLGAVTLNLNGSTTTTGNSMQVGNVTLTGNGIIQTSAIPVTIGGVIAETGGSQSLKKMGAATLTLTQPNTFTGGVNVGGGTLSISDDTQLGAAGASGLAPVTVATDYTPTAPNPATLQITGSYTTARPVIAGDATIDNAQNVTLGSVTGSGSLVKTGAGNLTIPSIVGGGLSVNNGVVTLAPNGGTSLLSSFGFATGQLDATNNQMIFSGPSATSVRGWLSSTGGIISSTAQADSTGTTAIGYLPVTSPGTWGGLNVSTGDIVTKLTYTGDINLDGVVNADDFALMDRGFAQNLPAGSATWQNGDLNYDGVVDSSDYMLADKSFALHGGTLSPALLSERETMFGSTYVSNLIASVPEPGTTSIVLLAAGSMMSLRRKRMPKESR
ncbi:MAG TPA: autotransporter-associated beta strand repeat-containing protein [Tepidisphaeraceae bacterium]|jgi:autotransporter-associated beta strand protein|nr:autotransporter-associated beta strand repeat-containing protein [Tepidisphaeraceae bacterium]